MTIGWHFDNTYSRLSNTFKEEIKPTPVHDPELVILNEELASTLNLDFSKTDKKKLAEIFSGNSIPCLLYTSPSPRDRQKSRMPSSA